MRIVVQVVKEAKVEVENQIISQIGRGFLLFVGFTEGDQHDIIEAMVKKVLSLRIFMDENGHTNLSLDDVKGEILSVSQFTLYADVVKGRRPSFTKALPPQEASILYEDWLKTLREERPFAGSGIFGANMKVSLVNDGPFTLLLDSDEIVRKNR